MIFPSEMLITSAQQTATSSLTTRGTISYAWDCTVTQDGSVFKVTNQRTGSSFSSNDASTAINAAVQSVQSGTVYIQSGVYPIGQEKVITSSSAWTSANPSVSIDNAASGIEGLAAQVNIPYPAPTGLVAYYNFQTPIDLSGNWSLGFWFKPSTDLSNNVTTFNDVGSPLKLILSTSANCASPIYSAEITHPEWVTASWKYYVVPSAPTGSSLPTNLANIKSIGIQVWNNPNCITPTAPYNIMIDKIHALSGEILLHSNISLIGAGASNTELILNAHSNIPMIITDGSNIQIAGLQLNGNYDSQDAIDACMGIYDNGNSGITIYNNYIHHMKGAGIKLRGSNSNVYENLVEWTENPNIDLSYYPSFITIYNNTLKYPIDDDNIRISGGAHNITVENNLLYGITASLLSSGDSGVPLVWRNKQPLEWNGIRIDRNAYNNFVQYNMIFNAPGYGITLEWGHDNTVQYNKIYYSAHNQISIQSWMGPEYNDHIIGNLIVGGSQRGINENGTNNEIMNNLCQDNAGGGIFASGIGIYGNGNYASNSINDATAIMSTTPPIIPTFQAGIDWQPPTN